MSYTLSNMMELGTSAPEFTLQDTVSGKMFSLEDLRGAKATLIMFLCNHCPYVIHVNPEIPKLVNDYEGLGVSFVGISSNDVVNYPQDGPDLMKKQAEAVPYNFPYLFDETQEVAKAYDAACTPDFYLFDENLILIYRGRLDNSRPGNNVALSGQDLREAIDRLLRQEEPIARQYPSGGCNIKWK